MDRKKKLLIGCLVPAAAVVALLLSPPGRAVRSLIQKGVLEKTELRAMSGASADRLKALHTALMLYHDSEQQFPASDGWMDAIESRIGTADMDAKESAKKLKRPEFDSAPTQYGFALNAAVSQKYVKDLPPGTILAFESTPTGRNAAGDPNKERLNGGLAITIEGKLDPDPAGAK